MKPNQGLINRPFFIPIMALAILATVLVALVILAKGYALITESKRDEVLIAKVQNGALTEALLPVGEATPLAKDDLVTTRKDGWARLTFGDGLIADLLQGGKLEIADPESNIIKLRHRLGLIFNKFDAGKALEARVNRLDITTTFEDKTELKQLYTRLVTIKVTGTEFIIAHEDNNPLFWVVALQAGSNDLEVAMTDAGLPEMALPITAEQAYWIAPIGPPSSLISINRQEIEQWLNALRNGDASAQQQEIGDVIWNSADASVNGEDFERDLPPIIQRGQSYAVTLENFQGVVGITLDPGRESGNPVSEVSLDHCDDDELLDLPIQNERLRIDFLQTTARVRQIEMEVYNRASIPQGSLTLLDPANQPIGPELRLAASFGMTETLSPPPSGQIYHYADLRMLNGCLLALTLIPPPDAPTPTPTGIPTLTPTHTPTPLPADTPTPSPTHTPVTPSPSPTHTPSPAVTDAPATSSAAACLPGWVTYVVQVGDTFNNLAERTNTSVYELRVANAQFGGNVEPGQTICLPSTPLSRATPGTPRPIPPGQPIITPTRTPTPVEPFISSCSPNSIHIGAISPGAALAAQRRDFSCVGGNLQPTAQGFRAGLVDPTGQNVLVLVSGTSTSLHGTIPLNLAVGQYNLIVTNPDGRTALKTPALTVGGPDIAVSITGPSIIDTVNIAAQTHVVISNRGNVPVGSFTGRLIISSDPTIGNDDDTPLAPFGYPEGETSSDFTVDGLLAGQSYDLPISFLTIPTGWPDGPAYLAVTVDIFNNILEANEDNNQATTPTQVSRADLAISQFSGPPIAQPGQNIAGQVELIVANQGPNSSASFGLDLLLTPDKDIARAPEVRLLESIIVEGLGPAGSASASRSISFSAPVIPEDWAFEDAYLAVQIDPKNAVFESNKDNNTALSPIAIVQPDLDGRITSDEPLIVSPGESISLGLGISNRGRAPAGPFTKIIALSPDPDISYQDRILDESVTDRLEPGASIGVFVTLQIPTDWPPGPAYIGLNVDPFNQVSEPSKANNQDAVPIQVGQPDLVIADFSIERDPAQEIIRYEVAVTLQNQGNAAAGAFQVEWRAESSTPPGACDWTVDQLAPGQTRQLDGCTYQGIFPLGPSTVRVDSGNEINESDETNNQKDHPGFVPVIN